MNVIVTVKTFCKESSRGDMRVSGAVIKVPLMEIYDAAAAKSLQSCLTLCDPRDGSPPGSPVPGILQARTLK